MHVSAYNIVKDDRGSFDSHAKSTLLRAHRLRSVVLFG